MTYGEATVGQRILGAGFAELTMIVRWCMGVATTTRSAGPDRSG